MADTFRTAYRGLLERLHHSPLVETNARTGVQIKMLRGGASFRVDLSEGVPIAGNRRYWPHIAAAEVAWQFMGTQDPRFILDHAPRMWKQFVEDGKLKTAYGYRWRNHFGRDQVSMAINALEKDTTNRQVYLSAWDPSSDGLGAPNQPKNIPCPVGFSLTRSGGELHCSMMLRSSDVFVGLPYDVMAYALTTDAIAATLGVKPGVLHVTMAHAHIYEPHFELLYDCVHGKQSQWFADRLAFPAWSVPQIMVRPDAYVEQVKTLAKRLEWNPWSPMPELVA